MTRLVQCKKLGQQLPGLPQPPFPGPKGQQIFEEISAEAWQQWLQHQTRLINEKRLSVLDPNTKTYLDEQRDRFFNNQNVDQAEGYVPEDQ